MGIWPAVTYHAIMQGQISGIVKELGRIRIQGPDLDERVGKLNLIF